jgi:hypothetical protein
MGKSVTVSEFLQVALSVTLLQSDETKWDWEVKTGSWRNKKKKVFLYTDHLELLYTTSFVEMS